MWHGPRPWPGGQWVPSQNPPWAEADLRWPPVQMVGSKRPSTVHGGRSYFGGPALGPLSGNSRYRVMRAAAAAGRLHETGAPPIRRFADANLRSVLGECIVVADHSCIRRFMPREV